MPEGAPGSLHVPVMLREILSLFDSLGREEALAVDCTLGAGGHAEALLSRHPSLRYVGIDADPEARERAGLRLKEYSSRLEIVPGYFDEALLALKARPGFRAPDFIFFDLGVSMYHFAGSGRGFSFAADEALDMRFSPSAPRSAEEIVNSAREDELADIIFQYGEERYSRRIARAIADARSRSRIKTSGKLAAIVAGAVPPAYRHGRIHPATRTFQALRIAVNDELGREERGLESAADLLADGGILAIIAFHSLEDRIAKNFTRTKCAAGGFIQLYKKPLVASEEECAANPPSRSAKLRAMRKTAGGEDAA